MATPRVVETLNVLRDREGGRRPGLPIVAVDQLVFDRREEALADGVIPAITFTAHAADDIEFGQSVPVRLASVPSPAVRVMHEAGVGKAPANSHAQRVEHEGSPHVIGGRPADHSSREQIDDDRQIEPTLPGPDIRDIGAPNPIGLSCLEFPVEGVLGNGLVVCGIGRDAEPLRSTREQAQFPHFPLDASLAHFPALSDKRRVNARAAVRAAALAKGDSDGRLEYRGSCCPPRSRSLHPRVETRGTA